MNKAVEIGISERAQHFLKVLIERYIRDGQPVGSRTLAKDAGLDLSPATIRNVMADLEELGLVVSPHTSAGRIPTVSGYRIFVDSLISLKPLHETEMSRVLDELRSEAKPRTALASASQLLSDLTHMAGVVSIPKRDQVTIRQIEFVPLSGTRVLVVMVTGQGEVHNRIIETARQYSRSELEQAANLINRHYAGRELEALRAQIIKEMGEDRACMDRLMARALEMANAAFAHDEGEDSDFVLAGQTNLMDFDELAQMDRLRQLFNAFTEKQEILHLLDRCTAADGVQIYIGNESGYRTLENCSVVTAPYVVDEQVVGVLGVIGPTRMAYDRVIPIVDVTAKLLGAALKSR
jgi:heat-inducible transcriptional repressor